MRNLSIAAKFYTLIGLSLAFSLSLLIIRSRTARALSQSDERMIDQEVSQEASARRIQLSFRKQVQEWKDLQGHEELGRSYREAMQLLVRPRVFDYQGADRMVRGKDRPPTELGTTATQLHELTASFKLEDAQGAEGRRGDGRRAMPAARPGRAAPATPARRKPAPDEDQDFDRF